MEGDAGASRLNPIDADDSSKLEDPPEAETVADEPSESGDGADQSDSENATESEDGADQDVAAARGRSRLSRGWLVGIAALLVLCAGAIGAGGYFALRFHHDSQAIAHNDAAALKRFAENLFQIALGQLLTLQRHALMHRAFGKQFRDHATLGDLLPNLAEQLGSDLFRRPRGQDDALRFAGRVGQSCPDGM